MSGVYCVIAGVQAGVKCQVWCTCLCSITGAGPDSRCADRCEMSGVVCVFVQHYRCRAG